MEARESPLSQLVHWGTDDEDGDPFLAGAYWALSWSTQYIYGDLLGDLLNAATVSNVERWNGTNWVAID